MTYIKHNDMKQEIIDRLEYGEETNAGETETWYDPVTGDYYQIPIEVVRDWDNSEIIGNDKRIGLEAMRTWRQ